MKKLILVIASLLFLTTLGYTVFSAGAFLPTVETQQECKTVSWQETEDVLGQCTKHRTVAVCDNTTAAKNPKFPIAKNGNCRMEQQAFIGQCKTNTILVEKHKEVCKDKKLKIGVTKRDVLKNYELDYGQWGKCSHAQENDARVIVCDSKHDGNNDGICQSGESCVQFTVSEAGIQRLVKNSHDEFVPEDDSFFLQKLDITEVAQ